jgi:hypothetical protein
MRTETVGKTVIDTLGIRIECSNTYEQKEILDKLLNYISSSHPFYIDYKDHVINYVTGSFNREYLIYGSSKLLASITTMSFQVGKNRNKTVYFIKIVWAGIKKYNVFDKLSLICMFSICSWLNSLGVVLRLCELDVDIDIESLFENILILPLNRVPNVTYYTPNEEQLFTETTYIEKINVKRKDNLSSRSYLYSKNEKERLEDEIITRFEVALKTAFFTNKSTSFYELLQSIYKTLDRYAILRFKNKNERNSIIQEYNHVINSDIKNKSRKLNGLHLEPYRLYPDVKFIEDLLAMVFFTKDFHSNMHDEWFVETVLSNFNN